MKLYVAIPGLLLAVVLQIALAPRITILQAKPNFVLVIVVVWATIKGSRSGLTWSLIGGVLLDLLSSAPFGTNLICLSVVSFIVAQANLSMMETNLLLALSAVFGGSILFDLIFWVGLHLSGAPLPFVSTLGLYMLPSAALNTLFAPLAYFFFAWLHRRNTPVVGLYW